MLLLMSISAPNSANSWISMNALSLGHKVRGDFPILSHLYPMNNHDDAAAHPPRRITYLDSAATSQKPRQVLEAIQVQIALDSTRQGNILKLCFSLCYGGHVSIYLSRLYYEL